VKGHGRRPASAYPHACHQAVPHETLRPGDRCPACGQGRLYELANPAHFLRIQGQPPLHASCWCCQRLRCCPCGAVYTAQAPPEARGDKYDEGAVALIALLRYRAGYWGQIESYLRERSEAEFSHGICPDCLARERASLARLREGRPPRDND
jgi:hypothetical protein